MDSRATSTRRRGMGRLALRKLVRRCGVFGWLMLLDFAVERAAREGQRLEARMRDGFAAHFADAIRAVVNALEGFLDFVKCVLLLREEAEGEILVVGVAARVGLVHAERARLAALGPGA